jgi:hypothetical protein
VESACKQLVSARLKQAGMIWDAPGAEAVATVRAWLKSGRWAEAMALRPARGRRYTRQQTGVAGVASDGPSAQATAAAGPPVSPAVAPPVACGLAPEVLATIRAEQARDQEEHPWRKAWSGKQQRVHHTPHTEEASIATAA